MGLARTGSIAKVALRNFVRSRITASLAILAAIAGTGGVIVCTGYAAAGRQKIFDQFQRMGTNLIVVTPRQSRAVGGRAPTGAIVTTLRNPDYRAILQSVPDIADSSPTVSATFRIRAGDLTKSTTIVGCEPAYFALRNWSPHTGSLFTNLDDRSTRRLALLGATAARDLFGQSDPTGMRISINRVPFTVAGVLEERGQGLDAANEDAVVYVPLETAMRRLMNVDYYASMLFQVRSWRNMDDASRQMTEFLGRRHRFITFTGPDFQVQNQKSLIDTQLAAFNRLTFFLRWIAASTLAVASLGIFGVTWIGVGHRSREIGTCRAIGATRLDVLTQFFVESIAGPLVGCGAGVAAAWLILRSIDLRAHQPFLFFMQTAADAAMASTVLYAVSGLACCLRAIRIEPSVGIRDE
jgi:putative ABC transport system permease protein